MFRGVWRDRCIFPKYIITLQGWYSTSSLGDGSIYEKQGGARQALLTGRAMRQTWPATHNKVKTELS